MTQKTGTHETAKYETAHRTGKRGTGVASLLVMRVMIAGMALLSMFSALAAKWRVLEQTLTLLLLHRVTGCLAAVLLLVQILAECHIGSNEAAEIEFNNPLDWLAKGISTALRLLLFILPVVGGCILYLQAHKDSIGQGIVARTARAWTEYVSAAYDLHYTAAWTFVVLLLLCVIIARLSYRSRLRRGIANLTDVADATAHSPPGLSSRWLTSVEPEALAGHFMRCPPENFAPFVSQTGMPGFRANFDLLTTATHQTQTLFARIPGGRTLRRWLTWRTSFMGTTVSEFCLLSQAAATTLAEDIFQTWGQETTKTAKKTAKTALLIVKDIPHNAPFLPESANRLAETLVDSLRNNGFFTLEGQALAYVPIDFADEEEYLARLSAGRRRDIRRKLKSRKNLRIEIIASGDPRLADAAFLAELYAQYLEVYAQSDIHFDLLTADFFKAILGDAALNARLFLYYQNDALIGHNLCFIYRNMFLVDKYVGFRYPMARESNLYFISWMENLAFARREGLSCYIAGWTDPAIKAYLGARFTPTRHAVYVRNPLLRLCLKPLTRYFEADKEWLLESSRK